MKISVIIVEDDKNYNNTLKRVIDYHEDLQCIGQFYSGKTAIEGIPVLKPDVVIMDFQLQDFSGSEIIFRIRKQIPDTSFIMCTNFEDEETIFNSLRAGAVGYLIKGETLDKIVSSIIDAKTGGAPMSNDIARKVLHYFENQQVDNDQFSKLTTTEIEIISLLCEGFQYKEIAAKKFVSVETIKKHISNIYRKLGVNNKVEAINIFKNKTI